MKISIVIGTYNQKETLKLVLESFFKQSFSPSEYELVVVDSFSSDGTDAMIEHLKPTCRLNYIRQENQGKSAARNRGIKEAASDIIFLTDADMVADPDLLAQHIKTHDKLGNIAVEGITYNLKKELPVEQLSPRNPYLEPYIKQRLKPLSKIKWAYFLSGNLSIRKSNLIRAGGFDENFSVYGWEDIELGYRLHQMRIPLVYDPKAINYHYHFVSGEDMLKRKYNMGRSAAYFYKKHPNYEIKLFLGMNPVAMSVFHFLQRHPDFLKIFENQYILEEYNYRLGLTEELKKLKS